MVKRYTNKIKELFIFQRDLFLRKEILKKSIYSSPDFLIIGAAKAGTTSLFHNLALHPSVLPPKVKELHYFGGEISKGLKWYLSHFPEKNDKENCLTYEATPGYFFSKACPRRVSKLLPDVKCIVLLRDPVQRAFSHWSFLQQSSLDKKNNAHIRNLVDKRSFEKAVDQELNDENTPWIHRYLERGKYAEQLNRWYEFFPKDRILILDSEEFRNKPDIVLRKITNFLNIIPFDPKLQKGTEKIEGLINRIEAVKSNKFQEYNINNTKGKIEKDLEKKLRVYYKPFDDKLKRLTGQDFSWFKKS